MYVIMGTKGIISGLGLANVTARVDKALVDFCDPDIELCHSFRGIDDASSKIADEVLFNGSVF